MLLQRLFNYSYAEKINILFDIVQQFLFSSTHGSSEIVLISFIDNVERLCFIIENVFSFIS